jgi:hypothetical protein
MQTQREELLNQLSEHGWRIKQEESELEWRADEMWQLESVWSPVGTVAYVTFLVDPQSSGDRKKGRDIWAVVASRRKRVKLIREECDYTLSLGQGWRERLPGFFQHLASFRT